MSDTGKRNRAGNAISKPQVILDYNRAKGGIDFSDQTIAYYSPARKSVKRYRKVIFECISIAVQNSFVLYRMFYCSQSTCSLESFVKSILISLHQVEQRTTSVGPRPKRKSHALKFLEDQIEKSPGRDPQNAWSARSPSACNVSMIYVKSIDLDPFVGMHYFINLMLV